MCFKFQMFGFNLEHPESVLVNWNSQNLMGEKEPLSFGCFYASVTYFDIYDLN